MLNHLWAAMIALAAATAAVRVFAFGDTTVVTQMATALFDSAKTGFELALGLVAAQAPWLGLFKIAEAAGLLRVLARAAAPVLLRLMLCVPAGHPAPPSRPMCSCPCCWPVAAARW